MPFEMLSGVRQGCALSLILFNYIIGRILGQARREIPLRTKGRVYQAVVHSILLYGCETWSVRVADERMLEVFDNYSIRRIPRVRHRDCALSVELGRRLCLTTIPALFLQRRLRWFGHATKGPGRELIKDLPLSHRLARGTDELEASLRHGQPRSWPTWSSSPNREVPYVLVFS